MIAPLPQLPLQPLPGEAPGRQNDPRDGGDAFAQILAAAPPTAGHLPGPPPIPEHGPAIAYVTAEPEPAPPAITDPAEVTERPTDGPAQATAEVFNQQGLFGTATASASREVGAARRADAPSAAADEPSRWIVDAMPVPAAGGGDHSVQAQASGRSATLAAVAGAAASIVRQAHPVAGSSASAVAARNVRIETEARAEPAKSAARRLPVREAAARSAAQVALHELEQGIHIAARTEALDESERIRLHDEIAALLARHGLSARSIRISAPARFAHLQEKPR